jgi:peptidyl-prolyl cis-trans isomerase D
MMQGFRKAGQSWLGRIVITVLFGTLIFSFAIWGIGDMIRNYGTNHAASIGDTEISLTEFRNAYQNELQTISRRIRRNLTAQEAQSFGLDRRVLERMIDEAALDEQVRRWGLAISNETIAKAVLADPNFAGADGKFSRAMFDEALRNNGFSEGNFLASQRQVYLRGHIAEGLSGGIGAPMAGLEALNRYRNETRAVSYVVLGADMLGQISDPSDDQTKSFFEERKASFRAPEYRSASLLVLKAEGLIDPASVTDQEALPQYERQKATRFSMPERRMVKQIILSDKDKTAKALEAQKSGQSFAEIATGLGLSVADTDLGLVRRDDMADPAVRDAAFSAPLNQLVGPVEGKFGQVLLQVVQIVAAEELAFDKVSGTLKAELAAQKGRDKLRDLHDAVEDQRASAKPLQTIASELSLPFTKVEAVDASGRDANGGLITAIAEPSVVIPALFSSDLNVDNEAIALRDGGYVWFSVDKITPSRERSFEEAKAQVKTAWLDDERGRLISQKAAELVIKLNQGTAIAALADEMKQPLVSLDGVTRASRDKGIPATALSQVFLTPVGQAASSLGDATDQRIIFVSSSATVAKPSDDTLKAMKNEFGLAMSDDIIAQFVSQTRQNLGVKIYEGAIQAALGKTN